MTKNWVFRSWVEGLANYHFSSGYLFEFYEWSSRKWVVSVLDFRWKMLSLEADAHCHWSRYAADMHKIPDPIFQSLIWESLMVGNINMNQGGSNRQVDQIKQLQSYTFHFFYSLWQILTNGNKKNAKKEQTTVKRLLVPFTDISCQQDWNYKSLFYWLNILEMLVH